MRVETQKGFWEFWEKVQEIEEVEDLDLGWEQWVRASDVVDPLRPFDGPADIESKVFVEVLRALNPGLERLEPNALIQVPISPQRIQIEDAVQYAAEVQPVFSISDAGCAPSGDGYPYDLEAVLDVLALNKRPGVRQSIPKRPVSVLIADSGLLGADGQPGSVFGWGVVADSSAKALDALKPALPEVEDSKIRDHGTQVASMVLGGPLFARVNAQQTPPLIKLHPVRLYTRVSRIENDNSITSFVGLPRDALRHALDELGSIDIVNLSLKTEEEVDVLQRHLQEDIYLFVVAAGNGDGKIDTDGANRVLPAQWGGRDKLGQRI